MMQFLEMGHKQTSNQTLMTFSFIHIKLHVIEELKMHKNFFLGKLK